MSRPAILRTLAKVSHRPQPCRHISISRSLVRGDSTYEPPTPAPKPNAHRSFWISFGRPIAKVFLGAFCTYQIAYLAWSKLESMEERHDKNAQVERLEADLKSLAKASAGRKPDSVA